MCACVCPLVYVKLIVIGAQVSAAIFTVANIICRTACISKSGASKVNMSYHILLTETRPLPPMASF